MEEVCIAKAIANVEFIEEIGGWNFKRPKFLALVDSIASQEISKLILAHKDRLARFGFHLLKYLCSKHGCELLVLNTVSREARTLRIEVAHPAGWLEADLDMARE